MKKSARTSSKAQANHLPRRLQVLQEQEKRLRQELKQITAERDQYKKSLLAMMHEHTPVNKKKLLALVGKRPPLRNLIAELEEGV
jgi:predicted  nucleic acid-binding Zn-ribbon protein